jgi:hypothetical protein
MRNLGRHHLMARGFDMLIRSLLSPSWISGKVSAISALGGLDNILANFQIP